jgi:hypothetical protein
MANTSPNPNINSQAAQAKAQADAAKAAQEAAKLAVQEASEEGGEDDEPEDEGTIDPASLVPGNWYPAMMVKSVKYRFIGDKKPSRVEVAKVPCYLPLLPDWASIGADGQPERLAYAINEDGKIVYADSSAQAVYRTLCNAVKQSVSLKTKVVGKGLVAMPKPLLYANAAALLVDLDVTLPDSVDASWEDWLSKADKGGYAKQCQDYRLLLEDMEKGLAASGVSKSGARNTLKRFDLSGMFRLTDMQRVADDIVGFHGKAASTEAERAANRSKVLERVNTQLELHRANHTSGAKMLDRILALIAAGLAPKSAQEEEDETTLD